MYGAVGYGLEARTKRLTVENLEKAFGDPMTVWKENSCVRCRVAAGKNPYGSLTVEYLDPEVEMRPDGTVTAQDIREAPLFAGGYYHRLYLGVINEQISRGSFLVGNFEDGEVPRFIVSYDGLDDGNFLLLRIRADNSGLTDGFIGGLKHTARYFKPLLDAEEDAVYYIAVIKSDTKLSQSGEPIKGVEGIAYSETGRKLRLRLFHQQFFHIVTDNGVCFDQGYVLDDRGNRLEPRLRLEANENLDFDMILDEGMKDANTYPTDLWTRLDRDTVVLSCRTRDDGKVHLVCTCMYEGSPNTLQYRAMDVIATEIITKLQDNQKSYGGDEDYSKLCWEFVYLQ